jgi:hypothetical protein
MPPSRRYHVEAGPNIDAPLIEPADSPAPPGTPARGSEHQVGSIDRHVARGHGLGRSGADHRASGASTRTVERAALLGTSER